LPAEKHFGMRLNPAALSHIRSDQYLIHILEPGKFRNGLGIWIPNPQSMQPSGPVVSTLLPVFLNRLSKRLNLDLSI